MELEFLSSIRTGSLCCSTVVATIILAVNALGQTAPSLIMPVDYLVRFVQVHATFRKPELEALAFLAKINLEFLFYSEFVCSFSLLTCRCGLSLPITFFIRYFLIQDSHHFVSSDSVTKRLQGLSSVEVF